MADMAFVHPETVERDAILPRWWRTVDHWTLASVLCLFALGMILAMAASPPLAAKNGLPAFHYVERQAIFGGAAIFTMVVVSMMDPRTVRRWATVGFVCALAAVMLLPMFGTDFGKGATRWYSLGFAAVQPSEFLKPVFVVFAAWMLATIQDPKAPPGRVISFLLAVFIAALLALQPDFGQACLVLFGWGVMYFAAGAPLMLILAMLAATILAGTVAYNSSEHFARRIDGFLSTDVDPTTQLGYAANAIREGGMFGVGVGNGTVKMSLPDAHTDFIIAVAAEEYGVVMVLLILGLYAAIVLRTLFRLTFERDLFTRLACTGLIAVFAVQAMINMGVAVRLLPAKGMTLPFVSYGGSSLIAGGLAVGMVLAFSRTRNQRRLVDHAERTFR